MPFSDDDKKKIESSKFLSALFNDRSASSPWTASKQGSSNASGSSGSSANKSPWSASKGGYYDDKSPWTASKQAGRSMAITEEEIVEQNIIEENSENLIYQQEKNVCDIEEERSSNLDKFELETEFIF